MPIVFVGLGCALVMVLAAVLWWQLSGPGKRLRFSAFVLYYTPAVTGDAAKRVGEYMMRENFAGQRMDARLTRKDAVYQLQLVCSGQPVESQVAACEVLAAGLSDNVFAGAAVEVQVCDAIFRPIRTIPHRGRFGRQITMNGAHLFYLDGIADSTAFDMATFLAGVGLFNDSPKIAQMNRDGEGYEFRLAVDVDPLTPEMVEGERQMASDLSRVVRGAPVTVHFCKGLLETLRAVEPPAGEAGAVNSHVPGGSYRAEVDSVPDPKPVGADPDYERG